MSHSPITKLIEVRKRRVAARVEFDDLFSYCQFAEVALFAEATKHQAAAITSDLFYPDRVTDDEVERYQDERRKLQESYPQALRIATLSLTHSTFETNIGEIARVAALTRDLTAPAKTLTIWPAKKFPEQDCAIDCKDEGWNQLKAYQIVRNAFIHNDGRTDLPLKDGSDVPAAAGIVGLRVVDHRMVLTRESTAEFVLLCRRLCMLLLERVGGRAL